MRWCACVVREKQGENLWVGSGLVVGKVKLVFSVALNVLFIHIHLHASGSVSHAGNARN